MAGQDIPAELELLKQQLLEGAIEWEEALETIKSLTKNFAPWRTSWWEKRRKELIKDHCQQCGASGEGTIFVLQHTWHPAKLYELRGDYYKAYQQQYPFTEDEKAAIQKEIDEHEYPEREICPHCSGITVRYRKKVANWICMKCDKEFLEPAFAVDTRQMKSRSYNIWQEKGKERFAQFMRNDLYQLPIILQLLDDNIRYLSFQDTLTYCKKCAFVADKLGVSLIVCPLCKTNTIPSDSDICAQCTYGEGTGVYTLTKLRASRWTKVSSHIKDCRASFPSDETMDFYLCLLQKAGLELVEIHPSYLRIKADATTVWKAISGR